MRSSVHAGYGGTGGMKRRLPITRKGEPVLAAISLPPLTDDANRHTPTASHPGSAAASANAALIPASANRPASAGGRTASPPSSTASAANAVPSSPARAENRRTQPPGQHERRQQRMAHPARHTPQPRHEDLPAAARRAHMTPVTRPEHQRPGAQR